MEREEALAKQVRKLTEDMIYVRSILNHLCPTLNVLVTDLEKRRELDNKLDTGYHG